MKWQLRSDGLKIAICMAHHVLRLKVQQVDVFFFKFDKMSWTLLKQSAIQLYAYYNKRFRTKEICFPSGKELNKKWHHSQKYSVKHSKRKRHVFPPAKPNITWHDSQKIYICKILKKAQLIRSRTHVKFWTVQCTLYYGSPLLLPVHHVQLYTVQCILLASSRSSFWMVTRHRTANAGFPSLRTSSSTVSEQVVLTILWVENMRCIFPKTSFFLLGMIA